MTHSRSQVAGMRLASRSPDSYLKNSVLFEHDKTKKKKKKKKKPALSGFTEKATGNSLRMTAQAG
jgi:hypothetical protein